MNYTAVTKTCKDCFLPIKYSLSSVKVMKLLSQAGHIVTYLKDHNLLPSLQLLVIGLNSSQRDLNGSRIVTSGKSSLLLLHPALRGVDVLAYIP